MAKQIVANMDIMHNTEKITHNEIIDPKKFTKEQLTRLYERGAVRIEDSSVREESKPSLEDVQTPSNE